MNGPATGSSRRNDPRLHRVILDDLRRSGLWDTLVRDFKDLYFFYLDEERRDELARLGKVRRFFKIVGWLFKGLVLKLSPIRRLLLLGAIVLALTSTVQFTFKSVTVGSNLPLSAFALVLIVLMLELKDKLLARDEIEIARGVQLALLPQTTPACEGWGLWSVTLPANDVGGDLVDYLELSAGKVGAALGDVAGKGLGAALLMAKLQATWRALAPECPRLDELGERLNTILHRDGIDNRFATLFSLEISAGSGVVRYLNAGHNLPYVLRSDRLEMLPVSCRPLGMFPSATFVEGRVDLAEGDTLVVYSDGLTEARDPCDEEFGVKRLEALLPGLRGLSPSATGERVLEEYRRFAGEARRHDDLSLLILRREVGR